MKNVLFTLAVAALLFSLTIGAPAQDVKKPEVDGYYAQAPRHLVLALHFSEYDRRVAEGLDCFVRDMVKAGDNLLVWTPGKMYHIPTNQDKKKLLESLKRIAKRDSLVFKKDINHPSNSLAEIIRIFRRSVLNDNKMMQASPRNRTAAQVFLSNYSREIKNYKDRYITPNVLKLRDVAGFLAKKPGEKRIIAFQDREVFPYYVEYAEIAGQINEIAAGLSGNDMCNATRMYTVLNLVQKTMLLAEELPMKEIGNSLKKAGIHYDVVLFKSTRKSTTIGDKVSPDLDKTFGYFAKLTGGTAVVSGNISGGLQKIKKNSGAGYDLLFNVHAQGGPGPKGIRLDGFNRDGQSLRFSVLDFSPGLSAGNKKEPGLVKVSVKLLDQGNQVVYRSGKMLRSQKDVIDISMRLPSRYKGRFKVSIDALDLVSARSAELISYETL
jgi:hypothetical protein